MTCSLKMAIHPRPLQTRVLLMQGRQTLLKALLQAPQHPRALATFLEALALWEGQTIHAALSVDDTAHSSVTSLFHDFILDDRATPLYCVDIVPRNPGRWARGSLCGMGAYRDLRQLLLEEVA